MNINSNVMNININRNNDDPFYRYKMPKLKIRMAGKGNGEYTILDNIDELCKTLNTPINILLGYISKTLGVNYNENKKTLTGHYTEEQLMNIIYDYIDFFVLCHKCSIPEITPTIENNKLYYSCSACGNNYEIYSDTKLYSKIIDNLIKYYKVNKFIPTKGTMVEFNPF
jgi:translation initiation factor 5